MLQDDGTVILPSDDYEELIEENRVLRTMLLVWMPASELTIPWQSIYEEPIVDPDDLRYGFNGNTGNFEVTIPLTAGHAPDKES